MFEWLAESTWGYPIIGAIHVLGLAWFGGTVLIADRELLVWKRIGLAVMLLTGALLFGMHPVRYYSSMAFRVKMLLFALLGFKCSRRISIILWIVIIFAARGVAFF
ncbi:MAG: hypothetical protein HYU27_06375 [Acidobacteria bacterium]|nr:hypothetical protein [Acidobacteriota bacterium]